MLLVLPTLCFAADLTYIGETEHWILSAAWKDTDQNTAIKEMHSITQFRTTKKSDSALEYDRIYSNGFIDCRLRQLFLNDEFYTDNNDIVKYSSNFRPGEFIVDLERNVILQTLYHLVCLTEQS